MGMPNHICQQCGVEFYNKNSGARYCSQQCTKNSTKKGTSGKCYNCGKEVYIPNHKNIQKTFCSWECNMEAQRKRRPTRVCKHCGREFKKKARSNAMFCSPACRLSSEYNMQQLAAMRKKQAGKKPTKLELLGYSILDEIGLEYEKQYIFDRFVADAYVKELNLIVQFDGDYWHGNTSKFPTLSEFQMKQTERDRRADAKARDLGHRVIRLWESDVYKDQQAVKNRILLKE